MKRRFGVALTRLRHAQTVLFGLAIANLAVLLWDVVTGGIYFQLFGIVVSSRDVRRPAVAAAVCGAIALCLRERSAATTTWNAMARWSAWMAAAAAVTTTLVAINFGVFVAGAADQYGYVSQARLWTTGHLVVADQFASLAPVLGPGVAPLGYRLARTPGAIVPAYPPGFPLAMALAQTLAGPAAVYYVVPLLAGLAVWLTFVVAARVFDSRTGLLACLLCATSPIFLFLAFEPMSDVPATAWWLLGWTLALPAGASTAFAAGAASAAAILTRPNLVPLAVALAFVVGRLQSRARRLMLFAVPVATACLLIASINGALYGSSLESGHGPLAYFFQPNRIGPNVRRYFGWLLELHTPVIVLAFVAPLLRPRAWAARMLMFAGVLLSCYLPYFVYENWTFLRFLMPALPLLFMLTSLVVVRAIEHLPVPYRSVCFIAMTVAACSWFGFKAASLGVFGPERAEDRYRVIGEYAGRALPQNAAVITVIQSGSIRWYGNRTTLRWDLIEDERLDDAIDVLRSHGYEPYILLEDNEETPFRERFAAGSPFGRTDWPPAIDYHGLPRVRMWAIADRARHLAGQSIATTSLSQPKHQLLFVRSP